MTYNEAMKIVSDGGHVRRPRMLMYDFYIRLEEGVIVNSTNEGYATSNYVPLDEDKVATDWEDITHPKYF